MNKSAGFCPFALWVAVGVISGPAFAETIELVTYYPATTTGEFDRLHADRVTVGEDYSLTNPADLPNGTLLVWDRIGVGSGFVGGVLPAGALHVVGTDDALDRVLFLPGADTGAAGTPDIRVGIGTATPSANALHILSGTPSIHLQPTADSIARDIVFGIAPPAPAGTEASWHLSARPNSENPPSSFAIANYPGGVFTRQLTLTTGGDVGIGTATPSAKFHLKQRAAGGSLNTFGSGVVVERSDATNQVAFYIGSDNNAYVQAGGITGGYLALTPGGNVGIGITNPDPGYKLHVEGSAGKPGGGFWSDSSDVRLKKNIGPLTGALERMLALRGVSFEWKDPASHGNLTGSQMGLIGQEVEKVFPEWVSEGTDRMKILSVRGFEALTVEAFREQQRQIEELRAENQALRRRVDKLEK